MTGVLVYGYLGGWALMSMVVAISARRLQNLQSPAPHPWLVSIAAGAVWPVLIIAIVELGAYALTVEVLRKGEHKLSIDA